MEQRPRFTEVPDEVAPAFREAEELIARMFERPILTPEEATITVAGDRYLLIRADSLSVKFSERIRELVGSRLDSEHLGVAHEMLYALAQALGTADAQAVLGLPGVRQLDEPAQRLAVGPSHFAHSGWGRVRIHGESEVGPDRLVLHYEHLHSFEADAYLAAGAAVAHPACVMNAGYSSGWCSEAFKLPLEAVEVTCRAAGDESCRFVMATRESLPARLRELTSSLGRELPPPPTYVLGERVMDKVAAAEAERDRSLKSLQALFENAPFGAFLLEQREGDEIVIAGANMAADEILDLPCQAMTGERVRDMFPAIAETALAGIGQRILDGDQGRFHDPRLSYKDDQVEGVFEVHAFLFEAERVAVFFRDVTMLARAEEAARAAERLEATATLAGGIAHDFNNLMAGVLGSVSFLRRSQPTWEEADEVLNRVAVAASQASDLAQQLLSYARGGKYVEEDVAFGELVEGIARRRRGEGPKLDARISSRASVRGDVAQLRQLVVALLQNALEAAGPQGQVELRVYERRVIEEEAERLELPPGPYLVLSVGDDGPGMASEVQARVFEPYFSTKASGRGLGLAAAYGVVKNHGGGIELESDLGRGTRALAYLPRAGSRRFVPAREPARRDWVERQGSLEAVGSLALGLAHDFTNLLQVATTANERLRAHLPASEAAGEEANTLGVALERCQDLSERLLSLGRAQQEPLRACSLNELACEVALLVASALGPSVEVKLELTDELPELRLARSQVENALVNLVFNSRDALPVGGQITLATGRGQGPAATCWVEVRDTGVGMPDDLLRRAREPFFTTKAEGGTGIGLAMADRVVRLHGGELSIRSSPGQGTQVRLSLPTSEPPAAAPARDLERVLIVDDNEHVARSTAQLLRLEEIEVSEARSGEEALARFRAGERYDVVLLDLVLEGLSGRETFRLLREVVPAQPIVLFSGYGDQSQVEELLGQGAGFLAKPFSLDDLLAALRGAAAGE